MKWCAVVPTIRPDRLNRFLTAWSDLFRLHDVHVIVVQDGSEGWPLDGDVIRWADHQIGFPRFTDMIRSAGIWKAWTLRSRYTISLDDDTEPVGDPFAAYERVFDDGAPDSPYLDVGGLTSFRGQLRGFPFDHRQPANVAVQYGGWHGILDYDGLTQLAGVEPYENFHPVVLPVPRGAPVTTCAMNMAWRTEYAPIMWQLPLIDGRFNRWGDIWSGLFQKRVLDGIGDVMVVNGVASVKHERASDPEENWRKEQPGARHNEHVWGSIQGAVVSPTYSLIENYRSVTDVFAYLMPDRQYAVGFKHARDEWLGLFT